VVAVDPLASLAPRWITVTLLGREWEIPPKKAVDWLEVLIPGRLYEVVPGWFEDETADDLIWEAIEDGTISEQDLDKVTKEIIEAASGRAWWWGMQILAMAKNSATSWSRLHGMMLLGGIDSNKVSLSAWYDGLYAVATNDMDTDQKRKFDNAVDTPPPGEDLDEAAESAAFMAILKGG
jgi:hypothetical protein